MLKMDTKYFLWSETQTVNMNEKSVSVVLKKKKENRKTNVCDGKNLWSQLCHQIIKTWTAPIYYLS